MQLIHVKFTVTICFSTSKSTARIQSWHHMIAPYVSNDTVENIIIKDKPAYWGN